MEARALEEPQTVTRLPRQCPLSQLDFDTPILLFHANLPNPPRFPHLRKILNLLWEPTKASIQTITLYPRLVVPTRFSWAWRRVKNTDLHEDGFDQMKFATPVCCCVAILTLPWSRPTVWPSCVQVHGIAKCLLIAYMEVSLPMIQLTRLLHLRISYWRMKSAP